MKLPREAWAHETVDCQTAYGKSLLQVCGITPGGSLEAWCYSCKQIVYPYVERLSGSAKELAEVLLAEYEAEHS